LRQWQAREREREREREPAKNGKDREKGQKTRGRKPRAESPADWDKPANFGSRAARSAAVAVAAVAAAAVADNRDTDRPALD